MRKHVRSLLGRCLAGGLALVAPGWAAAQQTTEVRTRETRTTTRAAGLRRVSTVIGASVRLREADRYGTVEDLVLNDAGGVEYVVISHDDRSVIVPWAVAEVDFDERIITIDTTPRRLETLSFARDNWPSPSDRVFTQRVEEVFGASVLRREDRGGGMNVRGPEARGLGDRPRIREIRPGAPDRTAPGDRPRIQEILPGDAPGDRPRVREIRPGAPDRPAPDASPAAPRTTPTAPGTPIPPGTTPPQP